MLFQGTEMRFRVFATFSVFRSQAAPRAVSRWDVFEIGSAGNFSSQTMRSAADTRMRRSCPSASPRTPPTVYLSFHLGWKRGIIKAQSTEHLVSDLRLKSQSVIPASRCCCRRYVRARLACMSESGVKDEPRVSRNTNHLHDPVTSKYRLWEAHTHALTPGERVRLLNSLLRQR